MTDEPEKQKPQLIKWVEALYFTVAIFGAFILMGAAVGIGLKTTLVDKTYIITIHGENE